jgi:archaellum component FlaC
LDKSLADIQKDINDFNATKKSIQNNLSNISRDFDSISNDIDRVLIPEFQNVLDQLYNVSSK